MNDWEVRDKESNRTWYKDSKEEAEQAVEEFGHIRDLEVIPPDGEEAVHVTEDNELVQQGGQTESDSKASESDDKAEQENKSNGTDSKTNSAEAVAETPTVADVPQAKPAVDEDPVDWMPEHFVDTIQGVPTVNRKGYAVIAAKYNVSVTAEPVVTAGETDFEYAEFKATAKTEEGQTYSGYGSAHVKRGDGDGKYLLNELAETRAMKRATAWATGIGMTAASELMGSLDKP